MELNLSDYFKTFFFLRQKVVKICFILMCFCFVLFYIPVLFREEDCLWLNRQTKVSQPHFWHQTLVSVFKFILEFCSVSAYFTLCQGHGTWWPIMMMWMTQSGRRYVDNINQVIDLNVFGKNMMTRCR